MPKEYKRICIVCGGDYIARNHNSRICSNECKRKRAAVMVDARMKRMKENEAAKKTKGGKEKTLTELAIEARKHGMTYGQYVAQLELQDAKNKR